MIDIDIIILHRQLDKHLFINLDIRSPSSVCAVPSRGGNYTRKFINLSKFIR